MLSFFANVSPHGKGNTNLVKVQATKGNSQFAKQLKNGPVAKRICNVKLMTSRLNFWFNSMMTSFGKVIQNQKQARCLDFRCKSKWIDLELFP